MATIKAYFSEIYPRRVKNVAMELCRDRDYFLIGRYKCANSGKSADLWIPDYLPTRGKSRVKPITSRFHATIVKSTDPYGKEAYCLLDHSINGTFELTSKSAGTGLETRPIGNCMETLPLQRFRKDPEAVRATKAIMREFEHDSIMPQERTSQKVKNLLEFEPNAFSDFEAFACVFAMLRSKSRRSDLLSSAWTLADGVQIGVPTYAGMLRIVFSMR